MRRRRLAVSVMSWCYYLYLQEAAALRAAAEASDRRSATLEAAAAEAERGRAELAARQADWEAERVRLTEQTTQLTGRLVSMTCGCVRTK